MATLVRSEGDRQDRQKDSCVMSCILCLGQYSINYFPLGNDQSTKIVSSFLFLSLGLSFS